MKKINKSLPPNALTNYAQSFPANNWNDFRRSNKKKDYDSIKQQMLADQGGLCGYCESKISDLTTDKQRVEHFHPKSDSNSAKNWALDWQNVFVVCIGGNDAIKSTHPLPANLSCDSSKTRFDGFDKSAAKDKNTIWHPRAILNPLYIMATPSLFCFDRGTGALLVNSIYCQSLAADPQYSNLTHLVEQTIKILNLNCQRLLDQRRLVSNSYEQLVAKAREENDKNGFTKLAARWFDKPWPSFFTTRRLLLGQHAESYLQKQGYRG